MSNNNQQASRTRPSKSAKPGKPSAKPGATKAAGATPSMAQYLEIKAANPDSLLWYRMGDFYELFFEDAVTAAQALSIVLTKRGKHLGEDIPMCGVPVVRSDEYLERLIRKGYRVAVCEQLEDPAEARKRGAKAVVHRDVVRLVTPGTLTEETLLEPNARNYLTALFPEPLDDGEPSGNRRVALASLDISTGEFEVGSACEVDLPGELARLHPREILTPDATSSDQRFERALSLSPAARTPMPAVHFDSRSGEFDLKSRLGVADLNAFGEFTRAELAAIAGLLKYVDLTQIGKKPVIRPPVRSAGDAILMIDPASRSSLELTRSASGDRRGSLLSAIDLTVTGPGSRELAARLTSPLCDIAAITARLDAVGYLIDAPDLREDARRALKGAPDIARAISRLSFGRGSPRDLGFVRDGLGAAAASARLIAKSADSASSIGLPAQLANICEVLDNAAGPLLDHLTKALGDELPVNRRDGGFVREGYLVELDEARRLKEDARQVLAELEARYRDETGVKTLKVRQNNILGFYIEVTQANAGPLTKEPHNEVFRHRQTMANAMRFVTDELAEIEGRIATAGERALSLEQEIFTDLARAIGGAELELCNIAAALAELDVAAALAQLAERENYVRPHLSNDQTFEIRGGRHPVVEQSLKAAREGPFIENDCLLGLAGDTGYSQSDSGDIPRPPGFDDSRAARIWLVTGPNMAGKSTFLRQNALICVLAQTGSYVPAESAHIGIVDRLFSRVGASDDLARGRSTFMVEMVETAAILNQATDRSLVILDEIGRGTSTFDGLSIAWACVEYLHEVRRCRTLFATHYHELTALAERLAEVANVTIDVKEWRDEIIFLHKVKPGAADRSYGIQVGKLAGLPSDVIARATEVLALLQDADRANAKTPDMLLDDLPLFAAIRPENPVAAGNNPSSAVETELDTVNPDELTPKAALEVLYRLKSLLRDGKT
ncbi:MAG: DNA mismatch repair protein MutS [Alphaproteobacteria bacterium]|nr:DNA mismatch repair protein MutS [Alphaproteobacteria bacterium]